MKSDLFIKLAASGLYSGYSPIVPGTTGTVPAWLIAYFLFGGNQAIVSAAAIVLIILSIYIAGKAEAIFGHDSKKIVIDEWAGMVVAVIFIPYSLKSYLIAFFWFRAFDAGKFFPANKAEKLPGGWGVTADDIIAGVEANLLTRLTLYIMSILT
jgi:phosphatidylglycerophosphatase A